jgi:hypothetical protein
LKGCSTWCRPELVEIVRGIGWPVTYYWGDRVTDVHSYKPEFEEKAERWTSVGKSVLGVQRELRTIKLVCVATLPTSRFEDLSSDVYYELARRYPEFKDEVTSV